VIVRIKVPYFSSESVFSTMDYYSFLVGLPLIVWIKIILVVVKELGIVSYLALKGGA